MKDILINRDDMKSLLVESIKRDMNETGYSSPTRNAISAVMDGMKDELTELMRGVLQEVIIDDEFKAILKTEFKHRVAKMLVSELSGAVEKSVNAFRQDPRLRADMIQAIERIISPTPST